MARESVVKTDKSVDGRVTFEVNGVGALVLNFDNVSDQCKKMAMVHGFVQRVIDAAAIARDTETGKSATAQDKYNAMKALVDHYNEGATEWNLLRASNGIERKDGGLTIRAVAEVQGLTVEQMKKRLEELAEKKGTTTRVLLAKLAQADAVAKVIARMKADQGPALDADDLLAELG